MTLADTFAPFIALPIAWALLRLKHLLPGSGGRRCRCMVSFPVAGKPAGGSEDSSSPDGPATDPSRIADLYWLPAVHTQHEHYTH